jgi:xylulokinase
MGYIIGADVGSQSVKALLMDPDGQTIATAASPCSMQHPAAGWAEQDPHEWQRALATAVRTVIAETGLRSGAVDAIALASQVDGVVAVDAALEPLRPAIIWLDRRATTQTAALGEAVGEPALAKRTGLNLDASHTAPKAMWLRDEEPEVYAAARWLAPVGAYLTGWLAGEVVQDHANASSTLLYDLGARGWSEELIDGAGLDAERLPPIRPAAHPVGTMRRAAAEALGLTSDCQVVVGTGDDHAAALGAGAVEAGVVVDITGTAEPVATPSRDLVFDERRLVETHAHAVDHLLLVENPGFVSGGSTQWLAAVHRISQDELFALAAEAPVGSDGVLFLPALSGATAPRWNDRMRGAFAGLAMNHDLPHLARAVLEGCAYALRDIIDRLSAMGLEGEEIRVVGGGARSHTWLQIKADATGRPMRALRGDAATSTGAAMLAGIATGMFADASEASARCVSLAEEAVMPRREASAIHDEAYARYRRLFDGVEDALA